MCGTQPWWAVKTISNFFQSSFHDEFSYMGVKGGHWFGQLEEEVKWSEGMECWHVSSEHTGQTAQQ